MDWHLLPPLDHKLHHILEVPAGKRRVKKNNQEHLLLPQWQLPRVDVGVFEMAEHEFTGRCVIGVRTSEEHRQPQVLEELQRLLRRMVRGIV